jgi:hypothetical protein
VSVDRDSHGRGEHEAPQGRLRRANRLHPRAEADQGNVGSTAGRALPHPERIILESPRQYAQNAYIDLMAEVMECEPDPAPLHLKIAIYHHKRMEAGHAMPLQLSGMKMVLMPRLCLLTELDPEGLYESL